MEQTTTTPCPHYSAYTLWWSGQEGETLPCPPDFKYPCYGQCTMDMGLEEDFDSLMDEAELNQNLGAYEEELYDLMEDYYDSTEHEQFIEEIKQGLMEMQSAIIESNTTNVINTA